MRPDASRCPFCGAVAPDASTRELAPGGISRSAILAFGAAVSASLALGCSESHDPNDGGGGGSDAEGSGTDAGTDAGPPGTDAGFDAGEIALPYGAPPMREGWV